MMRCKMCECELNEPEVYCENCIEALNATYELLQETEEEPNE